MMCAPMSPSAPEPARSRLQSPTGGRGRAMTAAAAAAGAVGDTQHVRVQAIAGPRVLAHGRTDRGGPIGRIRPSAAVYLQTGSSDPFPLVWRLQRERAGSGRAGRHRGAHHRPHPVRTPVSSSRGSALSTETLRYRAAVAGRVERTQRLDRRRRPGRRGDSAPPWGG